MAQMKIPLPDPPLLLITDRNLARLPLLDVIAAALDSGCRWLMVREKDLADEPLAALVSEVQALARPYQATIAVNGNLDVAVRCGVQGIHFPQGAIGQVPSVLKMNPFLIGVSAHSLAEAQTAAYGAHYVTLSPIFPTTSKPGYGPPLGLEQLAEIALAVPIPVVALGGITPERIPDCRRAGATGFAVLGGVMQSPEPGKVVQQLIQAWR